MDEYGIFAATEEERVPSAYFVPADLTPLLEKLAAHGVKSFPLGHDVRMVVEEFQIDSSTTAGSEFQQHRERTLFGAYREMNHVLPAGTVMIPVDQPLGRLVFYLLEPRSDDGFVNWNVLDGVLEGASVYPVLRTF
jgi:hypothetical protein